MQLDYFREIDLHDLGHKDAVGKISDYVLLRFAERNAVEPLEQLFHLVFADGGSLHIC